MPLILPQNNNKESSTATVIKPSSQLVYEQQSRRHWILMSILWTVCFFEAWFVLAIFRHWADPFYLSSTFYINSRLGEITAFALCVVMLLYTLVVTIFIIITAIKKGVKNINYITLNPIHTVVLAAFIILWTVFFVIFFKA